MIELYLEKAYLIEKDIRNVGFSEKINFTIKGDTSSVKVYTSASEPATIADMSSNPGDFSGTICIDDVKIWVYFVQASGTTTTIEMQNALKQKEVVF